MTKIQSVCVFCGSKKGCDPEFVLAAKKLGQLIGKKGLELIYGGGSIGVMGVIAEAVASSGGKVNGVMPKFLMDLEIGNKTVGNLTITETMHSRKEKMYEQANAFISLPGGIGTLDETLEVISWKQLRLHDKPIVLLDSNGYWKELENLIEKVVFSGFAHETVRDLFTLVEKPEDVFFALENVPSVDDEVLTSHLQLNK